MDCCAAPVACGFRNMARDSNPAMETRMGLPKALRVLIDFLDPQNGVVFEDP